MSQQNRKKEYFYSLDLLRFLAALLVTGFHLGFSSWINPQSDAARIVAGAYTIPQAVDFVWFGWVGVQIFFVISGFVIASSANGASPIAFLRSRIERLYPAAWICASLTALVWVASGSVDLAQIAHRYLRSVTLWPGGPWIDGQYWTLSCEIVFYASVFALLALRKLARLEWLAIGLTTMGSMFILVFAADRFGWIDVPYLDTFTKGRLRPFLFYYGQFFGIGILLWLQLQRRLTGMGKIGAVVALLAGCLQIAIGALGAVNLEERAQFGLQDRWPIPVLLWLMTCAAIALSRPLARAMAHWNARLLRAIRVLGLMTYPQYLVHFALGVWLIRGLVAQGAAPPAALLTSIAIVMLISWLIAAYAEGFVREHLRKLLDWLISDATIDRTPSLQWLRRASPRLVAHEAGPPA